MLMDVIKDLWKNKPLFITIVVGLAAVIYIIYKSNGSNAAVSGVAAPNSNASSGSSGSGATYVEENYSNYSPTTVSNPVPAPPAAPTIPTIINPAAKGTLGKYGAGKGDTNFWVYTVPAGATLTSIAEFAKWGQDFAKLANYRNNLQILHAAGVNTSNPYAPVPAGLQLSV